MRLSKQSRRIILLAIVPLVFVILYLVFPFSEDAVSPRVSVVFVGYTNDEFGRSSPQFIVSNSCGFRIHCRAIGPQVEVQSPTTGTFTNAVWGWEPGYTSRFLEPGEVTTYTVPPQIVGIPWRLGVHSIKPLSVWQSRIETLKPYLPEPIYGMLRGKSNSTQLIQSRVFGSTEIER